MTIALVGGGVRAGKSAFALKRARRLGQRRTFLATAEALDDEMRERIAEHQRTRGDDFVTVEEPLALVERLGTLADADVVVVDCLTLWLSNLLVHGESPARIEARVSELAALLERRTFHAVVVTNEVGMGLVPETPLGRAFRDLAGRAHQRLAHRADEIYFAMLGSIVRLRPAPISLEIPFGDEEKDHERSY